MKKELLLSLILLHTLMKKRVFLIDMIIHIDKKTGNLLEDSTAGSATASGGENFGS